MKRVAIVGAGIAGLTAAYELTKRSGIEAVLFDSASRLGGIIATTRDHGFVIEHGPDGWVTEKPWARALVEEATEVFVKVAACDDPAGAIQVIAEALLHKREATQDAVLSDIEQRFVRLRQHIGSC